MSRAQWQKSSFSEAGAANCVELSTTPEDIRIRESDGPDAVIRTTPAALGVFIRAVKSGRLDHAV